jgi:hypothetical protein
VERIGKLFLVLDAVNRRCLCCDGVFTRQQARVHAQLPCRPAMNALTEKTCELPCMHESAR